MEVEALDLVLLQKVVTANDAAAFSELIRRYQAFVYSCSLRILRNQADAEDVTQECFITLARDAQKVKSSLAGWLHRLAVRRSIDVVRRQKARRTREEAYTATADPDKAREDWNRITDRIDEMVEDLPDELRTIIVEYFLRQRTEASIANEMGVSLMTVSRRINTAIEELRKKYANTGLAFTPVALSTALSQAPLLQPSAALSAMLGKVAVAAGIGAIGKLTAIGRIGLPLQSIFKGAILMKTAAVVILATAVVGTIVYVKENKAEPSLPAVTIPAGGLSEQDRIKTDMAWKDSFQGIVIPVGPMKVDKEEMLMRTSARDVFHDVLFLEALNSLKLTSSAKDAPLNICIERCKGDQLLLSANQQVDASSAADPASYSVEGATVKKTELVGNSRRFIRLTTDKAFQIGDDVKVEIKGVKYAGGKVCREQIPVFRVLPGIPLYGQLIKEALVGGLSDSLKQNEGSEQEPKEEAIKSWKITKGNGYFNLTTTFGEEAAKKQVGHALVYVFSDADRKAQIWAGAPLYVVVSVNGARCAADTRAGQGAGMDPDRVRGHAQLKKGWNTLFVTVRNERHDLMFSLRIMGEKGSAPTGISYAATRNAEALDVAADDIVLAPVNQAAEILQIAKRARDLCEGTCADLKKEWIEAVADLNGFAKYLQRDDVKSFWGYNLKHGVYPGIPDGPLLRAAMRDMAADIEDRILTRAQRMKLPELNHAVFEWSPNWDIDWMTHTVQPPPPAAKRWWPQSADFGRLDVLGYMLIAPNAVAMLETISGSDSGESQARAAKLTQECAELNQLNRDLANLHRRTVPSVNFMNGLNLNEKQLKTLEGITGETAKLHAEHSALNKAALKSLLGILKDMKTAALAGKEIPWEKKIQTIDLQKQICRSAVETFWLPADGYHLLCSAHKEYSDAMNRINDRIRDEIMSDHQARLLFESTSCFHPPDYANNPIRVGEVSKTIEYPEFDEMDDMRKMDAAAFSDARDKLAANLLPKALEARNCRPDQVSQEIKDSELKRIKDSVEKLHGMTDAMFQLTKYDILEDALGRMCPVDTGRTLPVHEWKSDKTLSWDLLKIGGWVVPRPSKWEVIKAMKEKDGRVPLFTEKPILMEFHGWNVTIQEFMLLYFSDPEQVPIFETLLARYKKERKGINLDVVPAAETVDQALSETRTK